MSKFMEGFEIGKSEAAEEIQICIDSALFHKGWKVGAAEAFTQAIQQAKHDKDLDLVESLKGSYGDFLSETYVEEEV